jgi:glycosyltransferase involved in cell wall biosynthesis
LNTSLSKISVVVPNFNDAFFIKNCLVSIINQSIKPFDVIILDDLSTDNSVSVIKSIIKDHPYMRLILNSQRLGPTENSNKGLSLVRSEYVIFLSANDYFYGDLLYMLETAINEYPTAGIISGLIDLVDENGHLIKPYQSPLISFKTIYISPDSATKNLHSLGTWMTGQTMLYKTKNLLTLGGFEPQLGGLSDLFASYQIASTNGAVFIPKYLAVMRIHDGGFLMNSLINPKSLSKIFSKIDEKCNSTKNQSLFNSDFIKKIKLRIIFSSLNCHVNNKMIPNKEYLSILSNITNIYLINIIFKIKLNILTKLLLLIGLIPTDLAAIFYYRFLKYYYFKIFYYKP